MSHPLHHAAVSVKLLGGVVDDYLPIHDWLDSTKESFADFRHRALRHHSQGIFEAERVFGHTIRNAAGTLVPVRYICEQHIREDCGGFIPTVADWFRNITPESWMSRGYRIEPAPRDGPEQKESVNAPLTIQSQLPGAADSTARHRLIPSG